MSQRPVMTSVPKADQPVRADPESDSTTKVIQPGTQMKKHATCRRYVYDSCQDI